MTRRVARGSCRVSPDMAYAPFVFWFWDEPLQPQKTAE